MAETPPVVTVLPKKSRWWLWLLLGGGGVIVLVMLCAGGFAWFMMSGKAEIEPVIDAFQAKVDAGDFKGAYQSIGPEWKSIDTEATFTSLESTIHDQLGAQQSRSMTSINIQGSSNQQTATIAYGCFYEKGPADVIYTLSKSTGAWRIIGHNVNSRALLQRLTCPKCGSVATALTDFCGQCGAKMNRPVNPSGGN